MSRKAPKEPVEMEIDGVLCLFLGGTPDDQQLADVRNVVDAYKKAVEHSAGYKEVRASLDARSGLGDPPIDDGELIQIGRWPGVTVDGKPLCREDK